MSSEAFAHAHFPVLRAPETEGLTERARAAGHAAGYAEGQRQAIKEANQLRHRLEREYQQLMAEGRELIEQAAHALGVAAKQVQQREAPVLASVDRAIAEGAVDIAESIIGRVLDDEAQAAHDAVQRAMAAVDLEEAQVIRMHPDDVALIGDVRLPAHVRLVGHPSLSRGDAIIEMPHGYLDARISAAVRRARQAISQEHSA